MQYFKMFERWEGWRLTQSSVWIVLLKWSSFLKHWGSSRNIATLSQNYTVYAIDLLGFGASDKPKGFAYTMEAWAEVLRYQSYKFDIFAQLNYSFNPFEKIRVNYKFFSRCWEKFTLLSLFNVSWIVIIF